MRLVVFAYHLVGVRCLEALRKMGAQIALVVTHEDSATEEIWFPSVAQWAQDHGIAFATPPDPNDAGFVETVRELAPEAILSFYYRHLLRQDLLDIATSGAFNLHGSLLPRYRGRCPVNWVLVQGETETGATLHRMVRRADAGDIVGQRKVRIGMRDTARTLFAKIARAGEMLIREFYPRLCNGSYEAVAQDPAQASVYGGRGPKDGAFEWGRDARSIYNLVRAVTHPYPGAYATLGDKPLRVWWATPAAGTGDPGTILGMRAGTGVKVATGKGALWLKRVQHGDEQEKAADLLAKEQDWKVGDILS